MRTHVTILAWLYIVHYGAGLLLGGAMVMLFGGIGGAAALGGGSEGLAAAGMMTAIVMFLFMVIAILALPGILLGWGLLQLAPWARILGIVMSLLSLFAFPLGTALGIYGLWVLFNPETVALFDRPRYGRD